MWYKSSRVNRHECQGRHFGYFINLTSLTQGDEENGTNNQIITSPLPLMTADTNNFSFLTKNASRMMDCSGYIKLNISWHSNLNVFTQYTAFFNRETKTRDFMCPDPFKHCHLLCNTSPISFDKGSFWSLINVLFISVNEHCAKYIENPLKFRGRQ